MRNQITEDTKTSDRSTWSGFLTRLKDPITAVLALVGLVITFGSGVIAGAAWFVSAEVEPLRRELAQASETTKAELAALQNQIRTNDERTETKTTRLNDNIEDNSDRISNDGERIARMEAALAGTSGRVNRLHTQVTKNTEVITEVKVRGTPD